MNAGAFGVALIDGVLPSASQVAPAFNALFLALLLTCVVVTAGLAITLGIFLVRYRRGSAAPRPPLRIPQWKFEAGWTIATTLIFLVFFFWGTHLYLHMEEVPPGAAPVDVVARQWMWEIRHPGGRRELNELHVPVNQPILLRLTSEDVIHSFAVPAFRLKQDVVPGKTTAAWFEATVPGRYPIYCDQYCGTKHAEMGGTVIVETAAEHAIWLAGGPRPAALLEHGRRLFLRYGCSGCHAGAGLVRAPRLDGLAGQSVELAGGAAVIADDGYLIDSILHPNRQITAGYAPVMPSYDGVIPDEDLLDLVAYLKSLARPPAAPAS